MRLLKGLLRVAGGIVLLAALTGCGNAGGAETPPPSSSVPGEESSSPADASEDPESPENPEATASGGEEENGGDREIAWVPFGPSGPDSPPPYGWYAQLESGDCEGLATRLEQGERTLALGPLYVALAKACQATRNGQADLWPEAREELRSAADDLGGNELGCFDQAALELAERLAEADQDQPPSIGSAGEGTACEWGISRVDDPNADEESDSEAQGPLGGGTEVILRGENLYGVTEVWFGDVQGELGDSDGNLRVRATSPAADEAGAVRITVRSPAGEQTSPEDQTFTYLDDGSGAP
ncbi:IPT/TIG domain-containing protein [Tenggerimyces flavus]|uniref:IPT/TIG domain-containing protein n=1 Tax=Tenggerimyces flavus TaxID=1708749 RepID=A0ABV7YLD3_9ACTN|nr:IPT/TIG domain-containing protein [Tenggerimyces flavus]MBM7789552.1 putative small lipoprotein YifL [Tenggerimyces flavus]